MLTPQMIEEANKITGKNVSPVNPGATTSSRADQIRALAKTAQENKSQEQVGETTSALSDLAGKASMIPSPLSPALTLASSPEVLGGAYEAGKKGISDIGDTLKKNDQTFGGEIATGADLAGKISGLPFQIAGGALDALIPQGVKDEASKALKGVSDSIKGSPEASAALEQVNKLVEEHPHLAQLFGGLFNTAVNIGTAGVAKPVAGALKEGTDVALKEGGELATAMKPKFGTPKVSPVQAESDTIQEMISPKMNAKEIKQAVADGRVVPGQDPSLLKGGTPDTVLPSTETARATKTVAEQIPGASTMKAPDLYTALGTKIANHAEALKPVMQATPITDQTIQKITDAWNAIKAKQLDNPYIPTTANLEKLQANFERDFLQTSKSNSFGDLWDTRIKYDRSVPASVKNATSLSSDVLQAQKEIWLQNRSVLNDAINDASTGLDEVAQKTFSEMSDMYNAQEGIISSYKLQKGELAKIADWIKKNPIKASMIGIGVGAVTGLPQKAASMAGSAMGL